MRTTFNDTGSGGWAQPASPPRVRRRLASWAAIFVFAVMALGLGAAVAATYEALCDLDDRGEMDGE